MDQKILFSASFRNTKTTKKLRVDVYEPIEMLSRDYIKSKNLQSTYPHMTTDDKSRIFISKYVSESAENTRVGEAGASSWLDAVLLAYRSATDVVKKKEIDWESLAGVPAWLLIPKTIPISWGWEFYNEVQNLIIEKEKALNKKIARRRAKRKAGD